MSRLWIPEQLIAESIWLLAGFLSFLVVYNRLILQLTQGILKSIITYSFLMLMIFGSIILGLRTGLSFQLGIPVTVLFIYFLGEILRWYLRLKRFGSDATVTCFYRNSLSGIGLTPSFVHRTYQLKSDSLPTIRIVQMTDFHISNRFDWAFFHECVASIRLLDPDVLLLTGDFVDKSQQTSSIIANFKNLPGKFGVFATLGNHDYWSGSDAVSHALEHCGIHVISGKCKWIYPLPDTPVMICGHDMPWGEGISKKILSDNPATPKIVLCHTPDEIFTLLESDVELVFSGHLHGGQWRVPFLGPLIAPSVHGRLFDFGHSIFGKTNLFISAGIGTTFIPVRINCPPEILVVDVVSTASPLSHSNSLEALCSADAPS